jgi:hypothetical protein
VLLHAVGNPEFDNPTKSFTMNDDLFINLDVEAIEKLDSSAVQSLTDITKTITECINLLQKQYDLGMITIVQFIELRDTLVKGLKETINSSMYS